MDEEHEMRTEAIEQGLVTDGIFDVLSRRTTPQNNLYWGLLRRIAPKTGSPAEWLHERFKREILAEVGVKSTAYLTPAGFSRYIEKIANYVGSEWGIPVDLPAAEHDLENGQNEARETPGRNTWRHSVGAG